MKTHLIFAIALLMHGMSSPWAEARTYPCHTRTCPPPPEKMTSDGVMQAPAPFTFPKKCHSTTLPEGQGSDLIFETYDGGRYLYDLNLSLPVGSGDPVGEEEYYDAIGPASDYTGSAPVQFTWSGGSGTTEVLYWHDIQLVGLGSWQKTHEITLQTESWQEGTPAWKSFVYSCLP